jgi:hypothetical protein
LEIKSYIGAAFMQFIYSFFEDRHTQHAGGSAEATQSTWALRTS